MGLSQTVTQSAPLTRRGTLLGTLQYMAPEQLEGQDAEARTDLFALGTVIYEMVTGRKAFEGEGQASLVSAIMLSGPRSMTSLKPMTPPTLERAIHRALAKAPDDRWDTAHDFAAALEWASASEQRDAPPARKPPRWCTLLAVLMVGAAAGALSSSPSTGRSTWSRASSLSSSDR